MLTLSFVAKFLSRIGRTRASNTKLGLQLTVRAFAHDRVCRSEDVLVLLGAYEQESIGKLERDPMHIVV